MTIKDFKKLLEQFDENEQLAIADEYSGWVHIGGLNVFERVPTLHQDRTVVIFGLW